MKSIEIILSENQKIIVRDLKFIFAEIYQNGNIPSSTEIDNLYNIFSKKGNLTYKNHNRTHPFALEIQGSVIKISAQNIHEYNEKYRSELQNYFKNRAVVVMINETTQIKKNDS